jgi:hypothetical protein
MAHSSTLMRHTPKNNFLWIAMETTPLKLMVVCGPNYEILAVNANWPGSTHDSRVIKNSAVFQLFESGWRPFPGN